MPTLKPHEEAEVTDNFWILKTYGMSHAAGKHVRIICKGVKDDHEGYEVEHTDSFGATFTYFIHSDHLVPISSKMISNKDPKWKQVADRWQKTLWADKIKDKQ